MLLYMLTFASGKKYIGQTHRTIIVRMQQHRNSAKYGSQLAVHAAWRKYGEPSIEILGVFDDPTELHQAEIDAIASRGTLSPSGYNLGLGGETAPSKSSEVAAKIAAKAKGRKAPAGMREGARARMIERLRDPDYIAKVKVGQATYWTPERRAERAEASRKRATGVKFSDERRAKIAEAHRNPSDESRRRMSDGAKRRVRGPLPQETRRRIAEATARAWKDPEITARRLAGMKRARSE